jgi:transcriptional regulator with XRE-family HTH domain
MSIIRLAAAAGIQASELASYLGISERNLRAIEGGYGFIPEGLKENARARLGVSRNALEDALAACQQRAGELPAELRSIENRANTLWLQHQENPLPFLAELGVELQAGQVEESVLAHAIHKQCVPTDVWCNFPGVDGVDQFRVVGYLVTIPPMQESGAME